MACGALIVGSDTPPVREIIRDGVNGFLCDFWDAEAMAEKISDTLEKAPSLDQVRSNAQQTILREYDGEVQTRRLMSLILHNMDQEKADRRPGPDEKGDSGG